MPKQTLSDLTGDYLDYRGRFFAVNTARADRRVLGFLVSIVGNVQVSHLEVRHMDTYFAARSRTCGPRSLNTEKGALLAFFRWCRDRGYMKPNQNPLAGRPWLKVMDQQKLLIPASKFPALLDAARDPRDRMIGALGVYLFPRQSEIASIRLRDVSLERGSIHVIVHKSKIRDDMPICSELDTELRRWLRFYGTSVDTGNLDHFLTPARRPAAIEVLQGLAAHADCANPFQPDRPVGRVYDTVKYAIGKLGYPTIREGGHTLRRSGARALYDRLSGEGHDRAVRHVQAMLHHAHMSTTEHYLGLDIDRHQRDTLLRGAPMFPVGDNVVSISSAGGETTWQSESTGT